MKPYVTYDIMSGELTGAYIQNPPNEHLDCMIEVTPEVHGAWTSYKANAARNGVEIVAQLAANLASLKSAKDREIDTWRAAANLTTFPHASRLISCDALSRSDIDGVANHIALFGKFPDGFPGGWQDVNKAFIPQPDVDAFRAMYASMAAQGTANFAHAQALKLQLALAETQEEVAAIVW